MNTDDSSFDRLVDKASQWLDEKGKKPYELPNIRKFRKASTRFEDLVLDLGQKGCLLGSFIELLREAELDSHADTLEDHIESAKAKMGKRHSTGDIREGFSEARDVTRRASETQIHEFRRRRTHGQGGTTVNEPEMCTGKRGPDTSERPSEKRSKATVVDPSGSQDKSGMETVIEAPGDFLPYTSKMLPHLRLLGTALAISKFTESVVESPGDPDSKCISILSRWLDVTPNPTWKLFCERLQVTQVFNNLRETISKDKCL